MLRLLGFSGAGVAVENRAVFQRSGVPAMDLVSLVGEVDLIPLLELLLRVQDGLLGSRSVIGRAKRYLLFQLIGRRGRNLLGRSHFRRHLIRNLFEGRGGVHVLIYLDDFIFGQLSDNVIDFSGQAASFQEL